MLLTAAQKLILLRRWTPRRLGSALAAWYDASDSPALFKDSALTTAAVADADPLGGWVGKPAVNATQANGTKRASLKLNIQNGRPAVRFDGADDTLQLSSNVTIGSVYAVVKKLSGTSFRGIFTAANVILLASATLDQWSVFGGGEIASGNNVNSVAIIGYTQRSSTDHTFSHNGVEAISAANIAGSANKATSWLASNADVQFGNIEIHELVATTTPLGASDRLRLGRYLNAKWAVY